MTVQIVDGRARFGCSLEDFYRREDLVMRVARKGVLIPPTSDVAEDAPPALARVNPLDGMARWIVDCPDCRVGAEYVWLATPLMFCMSCGNKLLGGKWRRVTVPAERAEIERLLLARPDPDMRAWDPGESLDDLRAQNATLEVS